MIGHRVARAMDQAAIEAADRPWRVTSTGLEVDRELSAEEWWTVGHSLARMVNGLQWAIGDWLVLGAARGDDGEAYAYAQAVTDKSYESLSQAFRVAEAFPRAVRHKSLSWTMYREALRLPVPERLSALQRCVDESMGKREFVGLVSLLVSRYHQALSAGSAPIQATIRKSKQWRDSRQKVDAQCPKCGHEFELRRKVEQEKAAS